jgi:methylglutaconyl-CoA hydratase
MSSPVVTEVHGARGYVRLANPEQRNALDGSGWRALGDAVRAMELESPVRSIVLVAEGKTFCAGAQVDWMRTAPPEELGAIGQTLGDFAACPKPIVARVHGPAYGGGVGLVAACDLVVASREARFVLSEVRLGVAPAIVSRAVMARIGAARFRHWALTARQVSTDEAREAGLVDHVADGAELDAVLEDTLRALEHAEPLALAAVKQLFPHGFAGPAAVEMLAELRDRPEFAEGIAALREKRPAAWVVV